MIENQSVVEGKKERGKRPCRLRIHDGNKKKDKDEEKEKERKDLQEEREAKDLQEGGEESEEKEEKEGPRIKNLPNKIEIKKD